MTIEKFNKLTSFAGFPINMKTYSYKAYGMSIDSELELPELTSIESNDIDLKIRFGKVPSKLESPKAENVLVQSAPNEFLLTFDGVANYYATDGNLITIDANPDAELETVKLYLMGTVLTSILHQRLYWPIHASGVVVNGGCVAFSGISGAGKSTTASQFAKRGYELLADDVCAVKLDEEGVPVVESGYPQLRLWKDALSLMGQDINQFKPVRNELQKFGYPIQENFVQKSIPLKAIYILQRHNKDEHEVTTIKGSRKFQRLLNSTHKANLTKGQGNQKLQFQICNKVASSVELKVVSHSYSRSKIDEFIDFLENDIKSLG